MGSQVGENASTAVAGRLSGSREGARTSRPRRPDGGDGRCPNVPRCGDRSPELRRGAGTGLVEHIPVVTAYSHSPRTAAIRRFIVAGAAPRRSASWTTVEPAGVGVDRACQSK
jgi:hypothetical protein